MHFISDTGLPKPIVLTHGFVGVFDKIISIPLPPDRHHSHWNSLAPGDLLLSTTPFFHIIGYISMLESLFHNIPFVIPPDKPLSPDFITDVMDATNPTAAMFPPSLLEDMSQSDRAVNAISRLKQLHFGGAPLAPEIGDRLSKVTKLVTSIGSSECGLLPTMQPLTSEDWKYYEWNPQSGINLQPIGGDMYELVVSKLPSRKFQGIFHTFPELQEYRTKDVFIKHPTKSNKWTYHGRLDDVIVLSNGEKFNPVTMEKVIEGHPLVSRAIIAGKARFQTALLVEPNWNKWNEERAASELVDAIWPVVQQANAISPAYARVVKYMIGLAFKDKPFKITAKGSSQRHHIYKDYEEKINAIYRKSHADEDSIFQLTDKADLSEIKDYIENVVSSLLGRPGLDENEDFYTAGLDSLQTVQLTRILQGAIQVRCSDKESEVVTPQKVYSNPTTEQLSLLIHTIINGEVMNRFEDGRSRAEKIDAMVTMYTADIPTRELDLQNIPASGAHSVILTGSTGSLGNYLLAALLRDPKYAKVYCLNRSVDAASRQKASFIEKGLKWDSILEAKVEFLQVSFGAKKFGLDRSKYYEMLRSVDTIIHNAWKVDFNHSISSFENTHIQGMGHFVHFSLQSIHHAHIHFVSSIATVGGWKQKHGLVVPEAPVENPDVTLPQGYAESKHVAERICLAASSRAGVPTTILRVGQIAGPTVEKGLWNRQEWVPTIIATSKAMGKIPSDIGTASVDWIPVVSL
jgi:nucleoside-diphosphate-sugar epimerase